MYRCDGVSAKGHPAYISRGAFGMFIVPVKMTNGNAWSFNSHGEDLSEVARVLVLIGLASCSL